MAAAAILKNRKIAVFWPQFDRFRRNLTQLRSFTILSVPTVNVKKLKIQDGGGCHLEKSKNRHISATD